MCGADCYTDHRLVVSILNLRIQPVRRPHDKKAPKRLDVTKLNQDSKRQAFLTVICNQLDAINLSSENPKENWTVFHKTVHFSASTTLGHPSCKHQDWFNENDVTIFSGFLKKNTGCTRHIKMILTQYPRKQPTAIFVRQTRPSSGTCKIPGSGIKQKKFSILRTKRTFHDALNNIYGPKSSGATTFLSADGSTLLTDKETILKRWAEHFNSVLNRPSSINEDAIDRLPQI